ncbi:lipoyltransferase 1, mitochondrial-like [Panonychus citri]|uniref:lipoyltransferase 1, mitochondrial-like n=1 Tax=Panonychus citri TaxID=50023 RepID=UPI0023072DB9|nr:lipoyltransferase 1, mitochondrial-like [Panonychus citri]
MTITKLSRSRLSFLPGHLLLRTLKTNVDYRDKVFSSSVIISTNDNIYQNLALEDWLYTGYGKLKQSTNWYHLLLWFNQPCVVIGRHQNPWNEIHVNQCSKLNLPIARRNSGGGTVVHDLGNLNLCFLSDKKSYNRQQNNQLIIRTLDKYYGIKCEISSRENLITSNGGFKVSGTASKLSSTSAYHHCTLMVNVDLSLMVKVTKTDCPLIENKATPSVHASVENLSSLNSTINMDNLIGNISTEFINEFGDHGIIHVNPDEKQFDSIGEIYDNLIDWKWIFGKTPKFEVKGQSIDGISCKLTVNHGIIDNVETVPPMNFSLLEGIRFVKEDVVSQFICNETNSESNYSAAKSLIIELIDQVYS